MAIKVDINEGEQTAEYPCLKIFPDTRRLVLFTAPKTGVCLSHRHLGHYSDIWAEGDATLFTGSIFLSNDYRFGSARIHQQVIDDRDC